MRVLLLFTSTLFFSAAGVALAAPKLPNPKVAKVGAKAAQSAGSSSANAKSAAQADATAKKGGLPTSAAGCWGEGHVCWDNDGADSCNLNCCSKTYHQAKSGKNKGKDVCDAPKQCWAEGTKCWDNNGEKSCRYNCCSGIWHHDDKKGSDVCSKAPPLSDAVVGYGGDVDDEMRRTLVLGKANCWAAGTKCWNNRGAKSCVDNCCSKSYFHDDKKGYDVCAPIPADKKCFAQYTPCWDKLPTPRGKFYVEVANGKKVYFPSCFQCCARVARATGKTHWPAWTEYYIGDGRHDETSSKTHWFDAFVAGAKAMNPVQDIIDNLRPTDQTRPKRGGNAKSDAVARSIKDGNDKRRQQAMDVGAKAGKAAAKAIGNLAGKALGMAGPVGTLAGGAFSFLFGFFSKLTEPKWDLCD